MDIGGSATDLDLCRQACKFLMILGYEKLKYLLFIASLLTAGPAIASSVKTCASAQDCELGHEWSFSYVTPYGMVIKPNVGESNGIGNLNVGISLTKPPGSSKWDIEWPTAIKVRSNVYYVFDNTGFPSQDKISVVGHVVRKQWVDPIASGETNIPFVSEVTVTLAPLFQGGVSAETQSSLYVLAGYHRESIEKLFNGYGLPVTSPDPTDEIYLVTNRGEYLIGRSTVTMKETRNTTQISVSPSKLTLTKSQPMGVFTTDVYNPVANWTPLHRVNAVVQSCPLTLTIKNKYGSRELLPGSVTELTDLTQERQVQHEVTTLFDNMSPGVYLCSVNLTVAYQ